MIQLRLKHHQVQALKFAVRAAMFDANESIRNSMRSDGAIIRGCGSHVSRMKTMIARWLVLLLDIKAAKAAEKEGAE
jgi:uncharacterized protein (DUF305 family)